MLPSSNPSSNPNNGCFTLMEPDLQYDICESENSFLLNKDVPDMPARISKHSADVLHYVLTLPSQLVQRRRKKVRAILNSAKGIYWMGAMSLVNSLNGASSS